jgi:hypothetical protein
MASVLPPLPVYVGKHYPTSLLFPQPRSAAEEGEAQLKAKLNAAHA